MVFRRLFGGGSEPKPEQPTKVSHFDTAAEGDRLIVEQLRSMGADLSKPREVLHYVYLPSQEAAQAAGSELQAKGYSVEVRPAAGPPGPNPWLCLATIEEVVSVESATAATRSVTALAKQHGGEYDGWEAAGVP
jgi:regulator of RNase E activity RraB